MGSDWSATAVSRSAEHDRQGHYGWMDGRWKWEGNGDGTRRKSGPHLAASANLISLVVMGKQGWECDVRDVMKGDSETCAR